MLKRFRNSSEDQIQQQIRAVIEGHGAELHEKVRVADIVDIDKLDRRELGTYALQAHFDFPITDEDQHAVVAIEFDGPGHDPSNDAKKNSICQQANLPLFRIYGFQEVREINAMTLTRYLVELVFHARVFQQWKEDGQMDPTEPFMLSAFIKDDAKHIFDSEFDFIANANGKLTRALQKHSLADDELPHLSIDRLSVRSPDDDLRAFVAINSTKGPIMGKSSVRISLPSPGFLADVSSIPMEIAEFAVGMASDDLLENIRLIGIGAGHVVTPTDELLTEITELAKQDYSFAGGGGSSRADVDLLASFAAGRGGKLF
ncbi:DUF2726 domain-containing protein [Rhodophyticola porphyridii]|uniref:DUF2726 domain-containing protein n=1 Tax=Rhodophyticola porphyridii TaxID=1852017 RepID=A0A3L9XXV0_9RHOB|nr:DUF2726 domain-containing protein [Rhodophyticola porphyridii]RMA41359.1 DUF2726 domain-containing protein [Rhodophyticola porphyridii]